jgi:hypothetical protein
MSIKFLLKESTALPGITRFTSQINYPLGHVATNKKLTIDSAKIKAGQVVYKTQQDC